MEKRTSIEKHYMSAKKACNALSRMIKRLAAEEKGGADTEILEGLSDSVVKRFELTYEMFWKYLKNYLFEKHAIEQTSPREVFRACATHKITTPQETELFTKMVQTRNLTTPIYDQELAISAIVDQIPPYCELIKKVLERAKI